jgi:hypothetical protein
LRKAESNQTVVENRTANHMVVLISLAITAPKGQYTGSVVTPQEAMFTGINVLPPPDEQLHVGQRKRMLRSLHQRAGQHFLRMHQLLKHAIP